MMGTRLLGDGVHLSMVTPIPMVHFKLSLYM